MKNPKKILEDLGLANYKLSDLSKGTDHEVYLVSFEKEEVVLRIPKRKNNKITAQVWAFRRMKEKGIPVPEIILVEKDFLIESKIPGEDLDEARLSMKEKVMGDFGGYVKTMHSILTKQFGYLTGDGIGNRSSWKEFIDLLENF